MFGKKKTQPTTTTTKNETPGYIVRMREEIREVNDRLQKLAAFETTETLRKLNNYQKDLLVAQYGAMLAYRNVLNIRISYEESAFKAKSASAIASKKDNVK